MKYLHKVCKDIGRCLPETMHISGQKESIKKFRLKQMKNDLINVIAITLISFISLSAHAEIRLPRFFGDNMVLQRDRPISIWGLASPEERIKVRFNEKQYRTKADAYGKWSILIKAQPAGGPYDLELFGENTIILKNVMVGDVWICSGQSNMEWVIERFPYAEKEAENADFPDVRLFTVPRDQSFLPKTDISGGVWKAAIGDQIKDFSAVAYFFGRHLDRHLNVPIGLISTSWGGTLIEAWTSEEGLKQYDRFKGILELNKNGRLIETSRELSAQRKEWIDQYYEEGPGMEDQWYKAAANHSAWGKIEVPGFWENQHLPGFDGAVWYRKAFYLSDKLATKNHTLKLERIYDHDMVWVNGAKVGASFDNSNLRTYEVPAGVLKPEKNVLTVRVFDVGGPGGFRGVSKWFGIQPADSSSDPIILAGTWNFQKGLDLSNSQIPAFPKSGIWPNDYPTLLYNAMISPLTPMAIKGVIWYQGESNASRAEAYRELFSGMIQDWRSKWGQGDFPFIFVQLAGFDTKRENDDWPSLREAQAMALNLPNTGMAVAIDIGEKDDIHPKNKQEVGRRLGLVALKVAYGQEVAHSGPVFKSMKIDGQKAFLEFDHAEGGLQVKDRYGYIKGFAIAGADQKFHWAKVYPENGKFVVYSENVDQPVAVRYAWENYPGDANLFNREGLPMAPFRTDNWPGKTKGIRFKPANFLTVDKAN